MFSPREKKYLKNIYSVGTDIMFPSITTYIFLYWKKFLSNENTNIFLKHRCLSRKQLFVPFKQNN